METSVEIPLNHGIVSVVDEDMYDWVSKWTWRASKYGKGFYAVRGVKLEGKWKQVLLHREMMQHLLGRTLDRKELVDHANRDTLDNRVGNLRVCSVAENTRNHGGYSTSKTGVTGVRRSRWGQDRFCASIQFEGKTIDLGTFNTFEEAVQARTEAELKYFGEFARPEVLGRDTRKSDPSEIAPDYGRVRAMNSNNTSGHRGIHCLKNGSYQVKIAIDGKRRHLGTFSSLDEAVEARKQAEDVR